ncbi:hypothetical protein Tco_0277858 [Tanacetum coccineum]
MVVIDEHHDHDMGESSMSRDTQVDNQIVILPEYLQHSDDSDEFWPTPNGTPYWVSDVLEDDPRKVFSLTLLMMHLKCTSYVECNRACKPRRAKEVNTLNEVDGENGEIPGNKKRKRMTKSQAINCPPKLCLKKITGTETYMVHDFVENHNHPLMNLNNMDLSKARCQLHFDDYILR